MSLETFMKSGLYKQKSKNLIKLGFDFDSPLKDEYLKIQSLLVSEYHIKFESTLTIMKKYDIASSRTMDILFREFDIEARSLSIAQKVARKEGRSTYLPPINTSHFPYKQGWHRTWDNKQVFLRSSYELNFAKLLDEQKIIYDTECLRIKYFDSQKQKYRISVPDFYLPENNTIVEIKASHWYDPINIENRMIEYKKLGFNFQLILDGKLVGRHGNDPSSTG